MKYEYHKTKHEGIYKYTVKSGKTKYRVRATYMDAFNEQQEISKQGFDTLTEARAFKTKAESQKIYGKLPNKKQDKVTLEEYWKSFSENKIRSKSWNDDTQETNSHRMKPWLERFGGVELNKITRNDVQHYIDELYDEGDYSQETMKGFFRVFNQVINDAVEEDYLAKNKFRKVVTTHPDEDWKAKDKKISDAVYDEFMILAEKHMRPDIYRCFYLLTFGLRRGEAYGITPKAITFLGNGLTQLNIEVARTAKYPQGKSVKSQDSNRIIVVDEKATQLLKKQIQFARQTKAKFSQTLHQEDFIFITPSTGEPYYIKLLNENINKIAKMIDPKLNITPHMFRHTFATRASAAGVDSLQLIRYLGHADINMTKHYTGSSVGSAQNVLKMVKKYSG